MLESLSIENIAVIEKAEIEFQNGFNVMTGETGAGKSIIIDSLCAALGERTSHDLIRTGADFARVTAVFRNISPDAADALSDMGVEYDGELIITRTINIDGRNVCRINGSQATVGMLKNLGSLLVNIHGQHDSQALLQPEKHITFIDSLAENGSLINEYKQCFSELVKVKRKLESLYKNEDEKAQRLDYLNFQIAELEKACIRPGEKEELTNKKNVILNSRKIKKSFEQAYALLSSDDGSCACDMLKECFASLKSVSAVSEQADSLSRTAENISISLDELAAEIRNASDSFSVDESEISSIDERLDLIFRITHKYGGDEQSAADALNDFTEERNTIYVSEAETEELEAKLKSLSDELVVKAAALSKSRKIAAAEFEKKVSAELEFLDMPEVQFVVDIKTAPYSSKGAENLEFLISANKGEAPKPLSKIASGGELSRIMLAIKNVISAKDDIDTLIFDEVDSGVSGRAAQKIALKLKEVSDGRQVICVTHLAQIASHADRHLKIEKSFENGKTFTKITPLDFEQRKRELARIMGGMEITQLQLESAHEMLVSAGIYWD